MSGPKRISELIERYQAAFLKANGETRYSVSYERGWFVFTGAGVPTFRKRSVEVEAMAANLEYRSRRREAAE